MTITHRLAALAVGATLALAVTAGCAAGHTADGYIADMRSAMTDQENAAASDQQVLATGRMMCSIPGALDTVNTAESDAGEDYAQYVEITRGYCDVLGTDTANAFPSLPGSTATEPAAETYTPPPPAPITIGSVQKLNYGGQDVATWTVDKIDRCGPYLRFTITMTTGDLFTPGGTDGINHRTQWTDTQGITHDGGPIMAFDCGDELVSSYSAQPGKTYQGVITFDIPEGQLAALDMIGSDDRVNTYTPERTEER